MPPEARRHAMFVLDPKDDLWVFAYGSLMWNPGFAHAESAPATLYGYHRAFCIYSRIYRGTAERPGLVLGLVRGGACRGLAYRVPAAAAAEVVDYLDRRERSRGEYVPRRCPVRLKGGVVPALCYIANRAHHDYAAGLDLARMAPLIRHGAGRHGRNIDYLANTLQHLKTLGVHDPRLTQLLTMVRD
jgi:cation transport protein ChaC